ncbi:MAG TPA: DUF4230 domain-containing protein [Bacteroidales bacterium]|nr:DUF4230 domain-containing protein [Candidatus Fermentibacter daniensis]HPO40939.1 DUF4230 domain-containing protein [Bacteroidales bacterium]
MNEGPNTELSATRNTAEGDGDLPVKAKRESNASGSVLSILLPAAISLSVLVFSFLFFKSSLKFTNAEPIVHLDSALVFETITSTLKIVAYEATISTSANETWTSPDGFLDPAGTATLHATCDYRARYGIDTELIETELNAQIDDSDTTLSISILLPSPQLISYEIDPESFRLSFDRIEHMSSGEINTLIEMRFDELFDELHEDGFNSAYSETYLGPAETRLKSIVRELIEPFGFDEISISFMSDQR